jgi:hypothetical protein
VICMNHEGEVRTTKEKRHENLPRK